MRVHEIYYSERFLKLLKKLPRRIQKKAVIAEKLFRENAFHPSLRIHKLHGKLEGRWGISLTHRDRIIFRVLEDGNIFFISIGPHSVYDDEK